MPRPDRHAGMAVAALALCVLFPVAALSVGGDLTARLRCGGLVAAAERLLTGRTHRSSMQPHLPPLRPWLSAGRRAGLPGAVESGAAPHAAGGSGPGQPREPRPTGARRGRQVTLTTGPAREGAGNVLPVSYEKFTSMVQPGDTVFLGRYLVTGSEDSSLYLTVRGAALTPYPLEVAAWLGHAAGVGYLVGTVRCT